MSQDFKRSNFGPGAGSVGGPTGSTGGVARSGGKRENLGGIWERDSDKVGRFLSINVDRSKLAELLEQAVEGEQIKLVAFENKDKKTEKHPDFRIFVSVPKA